MLIFVVYSNQSNSFTLQNTFPRRLGVFLLLLRKSIFQTARADIQSYFISDNKRCIKWIFFSIDRTYVNFCTSREILNIVFMSVAVLHSGDLALASETASSTSPDLGNHRLSALPDLLLMDMTSPPVHSD